MKTNKFFLIAFILILILYFTTRLYNLDLLPIFFDEANYIYWAKNIAETNQHWLISLSAGKGFIFIWLITLLIKVFPAEWYVLAGRLPSVVAGLISIIAIYKLSNTLFSPKVALLASLLYVLSPFTLFYDRLALYDSMVSAMMLLTAYFAIKASYSLKFIDALYWGLFLGVSFLIKATAIFFALITPIVFLGVAITSGKRQYFRLLLLSLIPLAVSQIISNVTVFSSGYGDYIKTALAYTPSGTQIVSNPLGLIINNSSLTVEWLSAYYTPPLLIVGVFSLIYLLQKNLKIGLSIILLALSPILLQIFIAKDYYPRYLLFTTPYILISIVYFLQNILSKRLIQFLIVSLLFVNLLIFDFKLLIAPPDAPLPKKDMTQHITGVASGYGFSEIYRFVDKELTKESVVLVVQGSYSHYPNAFNLRYWGNPKVKIIERWPLSQIDDEIYNARMNGHVYFIIGQRFSSETGYIDLIKELNLKIVAEIKKPGGHNPLYIAEI